MENNLIAISGKINSGKDTVGKILQIISCFPDMSTSRIIEHLNRELFNSNYEIVKIADTLKNIICLLLNCTREQLEDREFKEKELGEEWWYYTNTLFYNKDKELVPYLQANKFIHNSNQWYIIKLTPRLILQLMGTECGRNIIHPDIWVNAFFSKYKANEVIEPISEKNKSKYKTGFAPDNQISLQYPKWIITDLRFINEFNAVKKRDGLTIRVNRKLTDSTITHESETSLDDTKFDIFINNNGSLSDLVDKIKKLKII